MFQSHWSVNCRSRSLGYSAYLKCMPGILRQSALGKKINKFYANKISLSGSMLQKEHLIRVSTVCLQTVLITLPMLAAPFVVC